MSLAFAHDFREGAFKRVGADQAFVVIAFTIPIKNEDSYAP